MSSDPAVLRDAQPSIVWWATRRPLAELELGVLSPEERTRVDALRVESARERSALARVLLRAALAEALGGDPAAFRLAWRRGPGLLDGGSAGPWLSVAHTTDRVLVALSSHGPIGVDVEPADRAVRLGESLIARVTAAGERAALDALPATERSLAALRLWTAKEAVLKATHDGLEVEPSGVEFAGTPHPTRLVAYAGRPGLSGRCQLRALVAAPGYVGTAAVLAEGDPPLQERNGDGLV